MCVHVEDRPAGRINEREITPRPAGIRKIPCDHFPIFHVGASKIIAVLFLFSLSFAFAHKPVPAKPFESFDRCLMLPDRSNDGDSFRVKLPDGREEIFRLYFVDAPEAKPHSTRSDEQAEYFGLTRQEVVGLGKEAKDFAAHALLEPFTIKTRWRKTFGQERYYAFVFSSDGSDLSELLVKNGLARIYGTRTPLPDGTDSRTYLARLRGYEVKAQREKNGGWRRPFGLTQKAASCGGRRSHPQYLAFFCLPPASFTHMLPSLARNRVGVRN